MMIAKAWRAKLIAKKIIEGDADNQYASIWRYAEELRRVNHGNTVKINVERPSPSIQPRFGSFYFCFDGYPNAWTWLMAVPTKSWCKHAFSFYPKCDTLMNNISESFNATILAARDKPILTMCEWIRKYLMNRLSTSASKLENWPHKVMPIPRRRLDNEVFRSGHWLPTWSIAETFQVTHSYNTHEFIVDIAKRLCSCNFWELVGIPCRHAVAALSYRKQNPDEFVYACYTREKFALCYGFSVSPINGQDMWPEVEMEPPLPPAYKNGPGRPKKIRIRETGSSVTASITKQSRKRVEKKPIIKRRQSERIKLSWFKRPITGEGISSDKPITLPENEDIPTSK
ncbi:hypothetical protein KIW84_055853 [Lathyrus oleraceus]|uniref:SWIM-type domain-containing protein n=1 Tax=Pisum sativum TaxID=3888 RepID=A0A9D5AIZ2_PEA|nr:hypothetical protein KIW84_055853 [Pisum sativum]